MPRRGGKTYKKMIKQLSARVQGLPGKEPRRPIGRNVKIRLGKRSSLFSALVDWGRQLTADKSLEIPDILRGKFLCTIIEKAAKEKRGLSGIIRGMFGEGYASWLIAKHVRRFVEKRGLKADAQKYPKDVLRRYFSEQWEKDIRKIAEEVARRLARGKLLLH